MALGVFAMAGVALVQLQTHALSTFTRVEARALADLAAQNRLTEIAAMRAAPPLGATQEAATFAGRDWVLDISVSRTADANIRRVSITVAEPQGAQRALAHAFIPTPADAP